MPRWNGWIGLIIDACWNRSVMSRQLNMKYAIMNQLKSQLRQLDSNNPVSDVFGAIQFVVFWIYKFNQNTPIQSELC
jgi:hypothetical protein